jgi:hypothetical protein
MGKDYMNKLEEVEGFFYEYERILRAIREDAEYDEAIVKKVLEASVPSIKSNDQKKTIKAFSEELITDKSFLKEFNAQVKNA